MPALFTRVLINLNRIQLLRIRIIVYGLLFLTGIAALTAIVLADRQFQSVRNHEAAVTQSADKLQVTLKVLHALETKITDYSTKGVTTTEISAALATIQAEITKGNYDKATSLIAVQDAALESLYSQKIAAEKEAAAAAAEAEAKKGVVNGVVSEGSKPLAEVKVSLIKDDQVVSTATTDTAGAYSLKADAGTYTLKGELTGYQVLNKEGVVITAQQTATVALVMSKVTAAKATPKPTATPAPSGGDSTAYSTYTRRAVSTSRGSFTADIMTFDLSSGHIRVVTDTANDDDCTDNCPVKSLASYVSLHGAFAGINGTYFCPTAYPDCAGKTNSFYWKMLNPRVNKMINAGNGSGEKDPFYAFSSSGTATFYAEWDDYSGGAYSGISCKPVLVKGGSYVVNDADLDDKQKTTRAARGAIGLKGQTFYSVIIQSATVYDMGAVMDALDVDNAINIDGGGSSAMQYKGSYKRGPGRSLPNAIVFVEQ